MIKIDLPAFRESIRNIEYGITRVAILHFDGFALQKIKEAYDERVFEDLLGSLGQDIGLEPTPMHETGMLRDTFMVTRDALEMVDYGFELEGLDDGQSTDGITDIGQLASQFYDKEVGEGRLIFGPIWDITLPEKDVLEEQAVRMFEKLYDGWL